MLLASDIACTFPGSMDPIISCPCILLSRLIALYVHHSQGIDCTTTECNRIQNHLPSSPDRVRDKAEDAFAAFPLPRFDADLFKGVFLPSLGGG